MFVMIHGNPLHVVRDLQSSFGKPVLLPFWALGYHQSSQKWSSQTDILNALGGYEAAGLPLESVTLESQFFNKNFKLDT